MIEQVLLGLWLFSGLIYQNNPMPLPNPKLKIYFEFKNLGIDTLRYYREDEQGFCERKATYNFSGSKLTQTIYWVNPENANWCNDDPDMRLNQKSTSEAWLRQDKFYLVLPFGEENITYVWDRVY